MAVDERNVSGGVFGKKVELVTFDDAADPKEAVSLAYKICADPTIIGLVGNMNSGTTLAASPIYAGCGLPVVMPVPTDPAITKQGFNDLFRVPPTDIDQGTDVAKYAVQKLGKKRFAIINDSTAYGEPLAEVVRKTVLSEGAQVVSFDGVNADDTDFRALLTRIRADNPDVLFFGGIYNEAGLVARQAREVGLNATFLAADGSFGQTFINIAGTKAAEGAVMSFIAPAETTSPTTRAFAERFRKQYGSIKAFAPLGYDSTNILLAGITNAGRLNRAAVITALHANDFGFSGVTGESHFETNGDNTRRTVYFFEVKNGKFVPIPNL
jgi:branched-chain amino acid transport system substrate-binding protein